MREEIFKALIKPFAQVNQQDVSAEAIMYFKHMDVQIDPVYLELIPRAGLPSAQIFQHRERFRRPLNQNLPVQHRVSLFP